MKGLKRTLRFNYPREWSGHYNGKPIKENQYFLGFTDMLRDLSKMLSGDNLKMIEIGSYMGESTMMFGSSDIFKEIHCIEPFTGQEEFNQMYNYNWDDVENEFKINTRFFDNIILHRDFSYNVNNNFKDNDYDFIYVDGAHDYKSVLNDLKMFLPKLKHNGIIGGHDWGDEWDSVKEAVIRTIGKPDLIFQDTSWLKIINKEYIY